MSDALDRLAAELGADARAAAEAFAEDLYVLTFQENRRGGDPVAHTPDGKAVFPDKFRGGTDIMPGDTWLCGVTAKGSSTFFASPLQRIDTAFFLELTEDQIDRIAKVALREHRTELAPLFEAVIEKEMETAKHEQIARLRDENDAMRERLRELEELYDEAEERIRQAAAVIPPVHGGPAGLTTTDGAPSGRIEDAPAGHEERESLPVERVGPVVLASTAFVHERYYGHISPNHKRLFLKPHVNGNLLCVDGRLHIPGLDTVVRSNGHKARKAVFDPRHGGWFIEL